MFSSIHHWTRAVDVQLGSFVHGGGVGSTGVPHTGGCVPRRKLGCRPQTKGMPTLGQLKIASDLLTGLEMFEMYNLQLTAAECRLYSRKFRA